MSKQTRVARNFEQRLREFLAFRGNQDEIEIAVAVELYLGKPRQRFRQVFSHALEILKYQAIVTPVIIPSESNARRASITFADPNGGHVEMTLFDGSEGCVLRSCKGRKEERKACGKKFKKLTRRPDYLTLITLRRRHMIDTGTMVE